MSDDNQEKQTMTPTEQAIIEIMKRNNAAAANGGASLVPVPTTAEQQESAARHAFWDTQPMPHTDSDKKEEGPIVPDKPTEEIRPNPYNMPTGFEWSDVNVEDAAQRKELYTLLANNYVEDDDCLFRFEYSEDFLMWALTPPGHRTDFLLGVRAQKSQKLVAFISGVPARVRVREREVEMVEINFLCVHKKLRSKRLAPVLIKEITRRVNLTGVFQAVYTAGVVLPVPVASARYHHRSLNPKKLVNVGFSRLASRMTMARLQKLYKLPNEPASPKLRPMELKDVPGVHKLLTNYLTKFQLVVKFTEEEVEHWLLPRPNVVDSFVISNDEGKVTDLCSFYHLPSSILGSDDTLYAAYSFYNVATSIQMTELMRDSLILGKSKGADVFNALNLMDNDDFLKELKFGLGDGNLQYYVYNWACPTMESKDVGIVLL